MADDRRILQPSPESIELAARLLAEGQLVGVPTETVYGLAADATNPDAVAKIYAAKGRPSNNPLIMHCGTVDAARSWVRLDSPELTQQWQIAAAFWPGPLTVVARHNGNVPAIVTANAPTVAVRVPNHPVMSSLLSASGFPIAAPSANVSNYVSPTTAQHVADAFGDQLSLILDGGACRCGLESTIIRLGISGVELLRPGAISAEQLESAFAKIGVVLFQDTSPSHTDESAQLASPGLLAKHYSPLTPMDVIDASASDQDPSTIARITFAPLAEEHASRFGWYRCLSDSGDLDEVARKLYTAIRDADASGCDRILIDQCDRVGVGRAIMDRIDRASH